MVGVYVERVLLLRLYSEIPWLGSVLGTEFSHFPAVGGRTLCPCGSSGSLASVAFFRWAGFPSSACPSSG